MVKKIILLVITLFIFLLFSVKVKAETTISLQEQYVQVGIGNDELIYENNLTYVSGYVNWGLEGSYFVTYKDRLDNIYKKQFIIISNTEQNYFLNITNEGVINYKKTIEVVDAFYITESNYYLITNYQEIDPDAPDQEKVCVTYYENNKFQWEYRYYKYSRYVKGMLYKDNLIVTGLIYNEDNNYNSSIILFEITKDRQIIKSKEIKSDTSCYSYGVHIFDDELFLVTSTNGKGYDYEPYKDNFDHQLVIFKLSYSTFKIIDAVVEDHLIDFYVVDTAFYESRIGVNVAYKNNKIVNGVNITNSIYEYNGRLEFFKKYDFNTQNNDYIGFSMTQTDVCFYSVNQRMNKYCVNIQYLNFGVVNKNILLDLENKYNINYVHVVAINKDDIYFALSYKNISENQFMGFAKVNEEENVKYYSINSEEIDVLSSKINNGYIVNTYKQEGKIRYKFYKLIEFNTLYMEDEDLKITKKEVIVNAKKAQKYDYINNVNRDIFGIYYNINQLIDQFDTRYFLSDVVEVPLSVNVRGQEIYQMGYKIKANGYLKLNEIPISTGFIIKDVGKYLLEINGENSGKILISFEVQDLTLSFDDEEMVKLSIKNNEFNKKNIPDSSYSVTNCDFNVKENYNKVVPLVISIIAFVILSIILKRKKA